MRQGYVIADWCCMCRGNGGNIGHLLLRCLIATGLRQYVFCTFGAQWVLSANVMDLLFAWRNWYGKHSSSVWNLVTACLMWTIWTKRNRRIFEELECPKNQILENLLPPYTNVLGIGVSLLALLLVV